MCAARVDREELIRKLRDDRSKLIVHAAAQAQRACDYVLNAKASQD